MKNSDPLVSIVTPCYNGELYIDRYFQSILNQTYTKLELIFINDGSTDHTEEKALSWKKCLEERQIQFQYIYQKNAGQASALNKGLKMVTGEYFVWPDSDDEMTADSVEKKIRFLQNHQEYDFCVSAVECREINKEPGIYRRKKYTSRQEAFKHMIFDEVMLSGSFMLRTSFLDRILPEREIYTGRGGQNPQILLPATWYGNLGHLEDVLYIYYIREESHSHSIDSSEKVIEQLQNYEDICIETIKKIEDAEAHKIIPVIHRHYARRRFGTAVDTMNADLIRKYYHELAETGRVSMHDRLITLKYTSPLFRMLYRVNG